MVGLFKPASDIVQFGLQAATAVGALILGVIAIRSYGAAYEGCDPSEFKCYSLCQLFFIFWFLLDSLIGDILACSDFYLNLYIYHSESNREEIILTCATSLQILRICIRGLLLLFFIPKLWFTLYLSSLAAQISLSLSFSSMPTLLSSIPLLQTGKIIDNSKLDKLATLGVPLEDEEIIAMVDETEEIVFLNL